MIIFDSGKLAKNWRDKRIMVYLFEDSVAILRSDGNQHNINVYKNYLPLPNWHDTAAVVQWLYKLKGKENE